MKNHLQYHDFLDNLIDYAGLFPPTELPLDAAIKNYANYINRNEAWMIGPFIIPVTIIDKLPAYEELFLQKKPLTLSITGRRIETEGEAIVQLKKDMDLIHDFASQYSDWLKVAAIEIPLNTFVPTKEILGEIFGYAKKLDIKVFCEVPLLNEEDWKETLSLTLDAISSFNLTNEAELGVKLRTGGVKAEMFPSPERVAFAIASCRDRNLQLKFTAGLHHPIRMYREEVKTKMHGFLNIFMAGMLAHYHKLDEKTMVDILVDENPAHFIISCDGLAWKELSIPTQVIKELRKNSLCSFGSCSFDEPKDELFELRKQQEVLK